MPAAAPVAVPRPAEGLTADQAAALIKMVDTETCDRVTFVNLLDFGGEPTNARRVGEMLNAALKTHPEFALVNHDTNTEFGGDGTGFTDTYRAMENGFPVTFTSHVAQRAIVRGMEDITKLVGCMYVPDQITVLDTRVDPGGKDARVVYRRTYTASKLAHFLVGPPLRYGMIPSPPVQEHTAILTKLDATGWRVSAIDDATITYN